MIHDCSQMVERVCKFLQVRPIAVSEAWVSGAKVMAIEGRAKRGSNIRDEDGSPCKSKIVGASFGPASL
jgi:hypothetical protein